MNSATNEQPDAGQGNGSVRTQNHPSCSPLVSSVQSSASSASSRSSVRRLPRSISGPCVTRPVCLACRPLSGRRGSSPSGSRRRNRHRAGNGRAEAPPGRTRRSEEHTSELQSHSDLVCRLLLEKKKKKKTNKKQKKKKKKKQKQ